METSEAWGVTIPPLNALVVNQRTGIPGHGCDWYIREFLGIRRVTDSNRPALARAVHIKVWNFRRWREILKDYGLSHGRVLLGSRRKTLSPNRSGWSSEGESAAHKRLRELIARDPGVLNLACSLPRGTCEKCLASADRPDVLFENKNVSLAVEVKSELSNEADLQRGVFQCVKYRSILQAEQLARGKPPTGWALLATREAVPEHVAELARLLDVPIHVVRRRSG
jgi:hypothetical protein